MRARCERGPRGSRVFSSDKDFGENKWKSRTRDDKATVHSTRGARAERCLLSTATGVDGGCLTVIFLKIATGMSSLFRIQGEIPEKTAGGVTHVPRGGRDGAADSAGGVARGGASQSRGHAPAAEPHAPHRRGNPSRTPRLQAGI